MVTPAADVSDKLLQYLKLSNLHYVVAETPFSVEIKIKKKFVKDFLGPQPSFPEMPFDVKTFVSSNNNLSSMTQPTNNSFSSQTMANNTTLPSKTTNNLFPMGQVMKSNTLPFPFSPTHSLNYTMLPTITQLPLETTHDTSLCSRTMVRKQNYQYCAR